MGTKEKELQDAVALAVSYDYGDRLFRNNSGTAFHKDGSIVQYGVGNPGGSDLIGLTRKFIQPHHVGETWAVFTALELKTGRLKPTPDQERFIGMVSAKGGLGFWGNDAETILRQISDFKAR